MILQKASNTIKLLSYSAWNNPVNVAGDNQRTMPCRTQSWAALCLRGSVSLKGKLSHKLLLDSSAPLNCFSSHRQQCDVRTGRDGVIWQTQRIVSLNIPLPSCVQLVLGATIFLPACFFFCFFSACHCMRRGPPGVSYSSQTRHLADLSQTPIPSLCSLPFIHQRCWRAPVHLSAQCVQSCLSHSDLRWRRRGLKKKKKQIRSDQLELLTVMPAAF